MLTECPSWSFGMNCLQRCDTYCSGDASCNHITGICNKGCKQGWNGPLCDKGKVSLDFFFRSRIFLLDCYVTLNILALLLVKTE